MKKNNSQLTDMVKLITNATPAEKGRIMSELRKNEHQATYGPKPNIWAALRKAKDAGKWDGEIETITPTNYSLKKGVHYFEVEDSKKRTVVCTSCPIRHGLILEAHLLTRYTISDGVVSLDGKPLNRTH